MRDGRGILTKREGNTALTFALLAPVLVLFTGGTIDYVNASQRRAQLQQAADATAVSAVARYSPGYEAANQLTAGGAVPDSTTSASANGVFNANWSGHRDTTAPQLTGTSCGGSTFVCRSGTNVYAAMTVTATFTPSFLGVLGLMPGFQAIKAIPMTVKAQATASTPTYVNYYVLVDASQSMGIAATAADMANLYSRVAQHGMATGGETGCVFGCHVPAYVTCCSGPTQTVSDGPLAGTAMSNETLAHGPKDSKGNLITYYGAPITLRIDSAITAIQNTITEAQIMAGGYANIQIGLYEINHGPSSGSYITPVSYPTSNYSALTTAAATIDLGNNNAGGYGDTDFDDEIAAFASTLPANGNGATAATPENYVFIITDGLSDNSGASANNHPTAAFNANDCKALQKNATVGVIYTTYTPIYNQNNSSSGYENNFSNLVAPYLNAIPTNLKACTSDPTQYYFEASDGPALISKMQQLFSATQKSARVSQ